MDKVMERIGLTRRQVVAAGAAAASAALLAPGFARADARAVDRAIGAIVGDNAVGEGRIALDLPRVAENGASVPMGVAVDSPMTAEDFVRRVHVFADGNPNPEVVTFHFSPASGEARATVRIRLAESQTVVALAEMSDGSFYRAARDVTVTIGGCAT